MTDHIATKRWNTAEESLQARIQHLQQIVDSEQLPSGFAHHRSNKALMSWQDRDLGISKVGVNTARDAHPKAWKSLQELRQRLGAIEKSNSELSNKAGNGTKKKRKRKQSARAFSDCPNCQSLVDELIMLRIAYLELLDHVNSDEKQSKLLQNAIQRHARHHGLKDILKRGHQQ